MFLFSVRVRLLACALALATASAAVAQTSRVSVATGGSSAVGGGSSSPSISADGRYVAFESAATNLVPNDTNGRLDVFVHDRTTGTTTRVSVATGGRQASGDSYHPSISADGRCVVFTSNAPDLDPADGGGERDIYLHDRATGVTSLVSAGPNGFSPGGDSGTPQISADGWFVTFSSTAAGLVADDTNGVADVFVRDRIKRTTTRVSVGPGGAQAIGGVSDEPAISASGRYVAFLSAATNLVAGDANGLRDVFLHDRLTQTTTRVSVGIGGTEPAGGGAWDVDLDRDGRLVAFTSMASNLVAGDTNNTWDAFVFDRTAGTTTRVSVSNSGAQSNGLGQMSVSISADGRSVAFSSQGSTLVPLDTNNVYDIFVHDLSSRQTRRVSVTSDGEQSAGGVVASFRPDISGDGRYVAFDSLATNLSAGDANGVIDAFVRDTRMYPLTRASAQLPGAPPLDAVHAQPAISADGRIVAFQSLASNLVANDTNGVADVFAFDRVTGITTRVSVSSAGAEANGASSQPSLSADGRYLAFLSAASNLVANDVNIGDGDETFGHDVFVHDRTTGTTTLVSVSGSGVQGIGESYLPSISADGHLVAFTSSSPILVPDDTNGISDVFVRDLRALTTERVSVTSSGAEVMGGYASEAHISADGRYVVFGSWSAGLIPGSPAYWQQVYMRDRAAGVTTRLSVAPNGQAGSANSERIRISADARYVLFQSESNNLVPGDTNGRVDVFLCDTTTRAVRRVSLAPGGGQLAVNSFAHGISGDGRTIAFTTYAGLVPSDINGTFDLYLVDRESGAARRVLGFDEATGQVTASDDAALSADGRTMALVAWTQRTNGRLVPEIYARTTSPVINAVAPRSGPVSGSTTVRIDGTGLAPGTVVTVGGLPALHVDGRGLYLIASTPANGAGPTDIVIDVPGHAPERLVNAFTYVPPPASATTDTDSDGLPDAFEARYSFDILRPGDAALDADRDGVTNRDEYLAGTHPTGVVTRYLAEGATSTFFRTSLALANPGGADATVLLRFLPTNGAPVTHPLRVPPMSRQTVDVGTVPGLATAEFSTVLESDQLVVLDRLMSWDAAGYGSHAETAMPSLSKEWYLAEGATHSGLELFYLLQNPASTATTAQVTFLRPAPLAPIVKSYTLEPQSRFTVWVDTVDAALASTDVSAQISASQPIAVERALYLSRGGQFFTAGHESAGVTAPALEWFLAEGATGPYFDEFVLLANPNATPANVRVTFLKPDGTAVVQAHTVAAKSRFSIWVDYADPALADTAVSTTVNVTNNVPIVVERAMWWPGDATTWYEAHNSPGATSTGTAWVVAAGEDGGAGDTETYVLIANPTKATATVRVTAMLDDGTTSAKAFTVNPRSRFNVQVRSEFPSVAGRHFSMLVESVDLDPIGIVVEAAVYSDTNGVTWQAGANTLATRLR